MNMHDMRRQYTMGGIDESALLECPLAQLDQWCQIAIQNNEVDWFEPTAMTLATASRDGQVSARIVLLKGIDDRGAMFYTNYESAKGHQLLENPHASLVLFWPHLEQQVRLEGSVERVSRELSEKYFHSRPRGSQIGAVISPQSQVIGSRAELEKKVVELESQLNGAPVPLPSFWGGYRLVPVRVEFWQGRENRLHDRVRYVNEAGKWRRERLAP